MSQYAVIMDMLHQTLAPRVVFAGNMPCFISVQILNFASRSAVIKFYFKNTISFEN